MFEGRGVPPPFWICRVKTNIRNSGIIPQPELWEQSPGKNPMKQKKNARSRIRTGEPLREWTLNPSPLTWLGDPRVIKIVGQAEIKMISRQVAGKPASYISTLVTTPWILSDGSR